ncbi:hypothetical protein BDGGKGIB_03770 [Nodularia sphaerocarpa UHCC 0038]|nr:hypothetical protein BDGGKGIB_03770 [Nodularia sphaerocarpa UHCC 0038]
MSKFGVAELRYEVTSRRGAESQRRRVEEMYFWNFIFKFSNAQNLYGDSVIQYPSFGVMNNNFSMDYITSSSNLFVKIVNFLLFLFPLALYSPCGHRCARATWRFV